MSRDESDVSDAWVATAPASAMHRRVTFAAMILLLLAFAAAATFAKVPLPASNGFVPFIQATVFVADLVTAILLFTQTAITRRRGLLVLANAYYFVALVVFTHTLVFPGAFAPAGLLGAGLQTSSWLGLVWHFVFPTAVIAYVWINHRQPAHLAETSVKPAIWASIATVPLLVALLAWGLIAADDQLPRLNQSSLAFAPLAAQLGWIDALMCALALVFLLRATPHSVLERWLMVAIFAMLVQMAMLNFVTHRFTLGWYSVRMFSVIASTMVMLVLLTEATRWHARLIAAMGALQRERDNKLLNAHAATASIADEVRQPLTAIAANAGAALRYIERTPPDLAQVRQSIERIVTACHRTSDVFHSMLQLFERPAPARQPTDLNQVISDVLADMHDGLSASRVHVDADLAPDLPAVSGHPPQLREVVINLVQNAMEAMDAAPITGRRLTVRTGLRRGKVVLAVSDTGAGLSAAQLPEVFTAFVTTKATGLGLGLTICRMIAEQHGGDLVARSDGPGATFELSLPLDAASQTPASGSPAEA